MAGTFDRLVALALRRVRMMTIFLLFGAVTVIAANGASWASSFVILASVLTVVCGWGAIRLWTWARSGPRNET